MSYDVTILAGFLIYGLVSGLLIILIIPETRQSIRNSWYVSKIKREMRKAQEGIPDIPEYEDDDE